MANVSIESSFELETLETVVHHFYRYLQRGIGDSSPLDKVIRETGETDSGKALNLVLKEYARRRNTLEPAGRFVVLPVPKNFERLQIGDYEDDSDKFLIIDLQGGYDR